MQMKCKKTVSSFILCTVLIVAMALCTAGCNGSTENKTSDSATAGETVHADGSVLGEGDREFSLTVADKEGNETHLTIHTDKEMVGEALEELGVIEGEESEYGLYVKTVNGFTADYDADGVYWAFYVNGEYAQTGVDSTAITEEDSYSFRVE